MTYIDLVFQRQMTWPGRVAQSVGHMNCNSEVLDSIPGLATYFRFSFADLIGAVVSYWQKESGSFRSYSCSIRWFRPGSFRPDFQGESFRPNWGGSFRPNF